MLFVFSALAFLSTFSLVITLTSIGYHRGLCHRALTLHPLLHKAVSRYSVWLTGIDAKAWVVMHRLHHQHSDDARDPHSPKNVGLLGMPLAQIRGYNGVVDGLNRGDPELVAIGGDLESSWPARKNLWIAPYVLHIVLGLLLSQLIPWPIVLAFFLGLVSHAGQGIIINYFGHAIGGRNFDTPDNSRNNHPAAWLLLGEGFQNNHHRYPTSARFSYRATEVDFGYALCRVFAALGLLTIDNSTLIPRPSSAVTA